MPKLFIRHLPVDEVKNQFEMVVWSMKKVIEKLTASRMDSTE